METVILKTYLEKIGGIIEFVPQYRELRITYNIRREGVCAQIYKLIALSSIHPCNMPIIIDTLEFVGSFAKGQKTIGLQTLCYEGYNVSDIDTFVVVKKVQDEYIVCACGFFRLTWDVLSQARKWDKMGKGSIPKSCYDALQSIKKEVDYEMYAQVIRELYNIEKTLKKSTHCPHTSYRWYEVDKIPMDISSYHHIVDDELIHKSNGILYGIADNGKTAFALKKSDTNPFLSAEDCCVVVGDYWIIGIAFDEDGQYFEKIMGDHT